MWIGLKTGFLAPSAGWVFGACAWPMAVAKVSMLKRLTKVSVTEPLAPIATSPSYQPIPNGAFGFWIANRTSGVPGLKPLTVMTSFSVKPGEVSTWTEAVACSAQPSGRPWVRTILKSNELAACAGEASAAPQASAEASPSGRRRASLAGKTFRGHLVSSCRPRRS